MDNLLIFDFQTVEVDFVEFFITKQIGIHLNVYYISNISYVVIIITDGCELTGRIQNSICPKLIHSSIYRTIFY